MQTGRPRTALGAHCSLIPAHSQENGESEHNLSKEVAVVGHSQERHRRRLRGGGGMGSSLTPLHGSRLPGGRVPAGCPSARPRTDEGDHSSSRLPRPPSPGTAAGRRRPSRPRPGPRPRRSPPSPLTRAGLPPAACWAGRGARRRRRWPRRWRSGARWGTCCRRPWCECSRGAQPSRAEPSPAERARGMPGRGRSPPGRSSAGKTGLRPASPGERRGGRVVQRRAGGGGAAVINLPSPSRTPAGSPPRRGAGEREGAFPPVPAGPGRAWPAARCPRLEVVPRSPAAGPVPAAGPTPAARPNPAAPRPPPTS